MANWKNRIYTVIFGTETKAGRNFDIVLLWAIVGSVVLVMLSTVKSLVIPYRPFFRSSEIVFTLFFTVEYMLRIYSSPKPLKYITSFYGIIDFLAIVPSYLEFIFLNSHYLFMIRTFRLIRVFRILKLGRYVSEAEILLRALRQSMYKITVFFGSVLTLVLFLGTLMYLIEGEESGFVSIPQGIYWAIVTITTVGYGDIAPITVMGRLVASLAMLTGYSIIAVPTGIISMEINRAHKSAKNKKADIVKVCPKCTFTDNDSDANYCKRCGTRFIE